MDGRPIRASKCAANGAKNTGSSSSASTRPNSAGNTNSSDGKIASHNVGWSLTVLSTMPSIPSIPRVRGHPPGSASSDPGSTRRLFQVEVANAARCHANWHHVACCSPPRSPFDPGRHDVGSSRLHVPKVGRSASEICSPPPEPVEYAGNEYAALPVRHVFLCCAIYLADPPGHLRFGTDRCVY